MFCEFDLNDSMLFNCVFKFFGMELGAGVSKMLRSAMLIFVCFIENGDFYL